MKFYGFRDVAAALLVWMALGAGAFGGTPQPFGTQLAEIQRTVTAMAADPNRPYVYCVTTANTVMAVNTNTLSIAAEIPIGATPIRLSISPDGTRLYVANNGSSSAAIGVVDLTTFTALPSIALKAEPSDVVAGQNGLLFVLGPFSNFESSIDVVNASTGAVLGTYNASPIFGSLLAITPDYKTLFCADAGEDPASLSSFDVSTGVPTLITAGTFNIYGGNGEALVMNPTGSSLVYCTGSGQNGYQIALIPTNNIDATSGYFNTDAYPYDGAFSPDGSIFYTAPFTQGTIYAYSTTTFQPLSSASLDDTKSLVCDSTGQFIFAAGESLWGDFAPNLRILSSGLAPISGSFPPITSSSTATVNASQPFNFTLTSSSPNVTWSASNLPAGLTLDANSGLISGQVDAPGAYTINITATDPSSVPSPGTLTLTVNPELTVSVVGNGAITSGYLGATYLPLGSTYTIAATPAEGYTFTGWSGGAASAFAVISGVIQQNTSLTATFSPASLSGSTPPFGTQLAQIQRTVMAMAADPNRPYVYCTTNVNTVMAVDTNTLSIASEIPIGSNPTRLSISPDGTRLYVANSGSSAAAIGVVDLTTFTALPSITLTAEPIDVVASQNGVIFVLGDFPGSYEAAIEGVDASTGAVLGSYSSYDLYGGFLALTPDGQTLFYGNTDSEPATLLSLDVSSGVPTLITAGAFGDFGSNGEALVMNPAGSSFVFCTQYASGLALLPTYNINATLGTFDVGASSSNAAFSPDGSVFYTVPSSLGTIESYSLATFQQLSSVALASTASLVCDGTGRLIFAAGAGSAPTLRILSTGVGALSGSGPVITSNGAATANAGQPFTFTLTSSTPNVAWSASNLPAGLTLDANSGKISGQVTAPGSYTINITATAASSGAGTLTLTVNPELTVTVVGNGTVTSGYLGSAYPQLGSTYSITATPAAGYVFAGWSGSVASSYNVIAGVIEQNTSLTATFTTGSSSATPPFGAQLAQVPRTVKAMAADPSRPYVYCVTTANTVMAVDTNTLSIASEIPIGSNPTRLSISPDGTRLYVANSGSSVAAIGVVDLTTFTALPSIPLSAEPFDVVAGQNGLLFVLGDFLQNDEGMIEAVNASTGAVSGSYSSPYLSQGFLALTPDRQTLFFGNIDTEPAGLISFDISSGVPTLITNGIFDNYGSSGEALVVSPTGSSLVFCTMTGQNGIVLIPTNNIDATLGTFDVSGSPANGAFSPDGSIFYTAPSSQEKLYAYSTTTFQPLTSAPLDDTASLVCDSTGRFIFAAGNGGSDGSAPNLRILSAVMGPVSGSNPVITSSTAATANAGQPFNFTLTSSTPNVTWSSSNLPTGLTLGSHSGVISGQVAAPGAYSINVTATAASGQSAGTLTLTVNPELTVAVVGNGAVTSGYLGNTWPQLGSTYMITAAPADGYAFGGWSGSVTSSNAVIAGIIQQNMSVTATFVPVGPSSFTFTVDIAGPGVVQPASLVGSTTQTSGAQETLLAIPMLGARFTGWTGAVSSSDPSLLVTVDSPMTLTANFESITGYAGSYTLAGPPSAANGITAITLNLNSFGNFTATLLTSSGRYPFAGNFLSASGFSVAVASPTTTYIIQLQITMTNGVPTLTGSVSANGQTVSLTGYRAGIFSAHSPPAALGKYTFLLPPIGGTGAPQGWGYGAGRVTATGAVTLAGTLGDATPFSAGGLLSDSGNLLVATPLYATKGYLQGWVIFRDLPQSDFDGTLSWLRPISTVAGPYAAGFSVSPAILGSLLPAPPHNGNLFGANSASITFSGSGLASSTSTQVAIWPMNKVVPRSNDRNHLRCVVGSATGAISGSFIPPGAAKSIPFSGCVFSKTGTAAGLFQEKLISGAFHLTPEPAAVGAPLAPKR